MDTNKLNGNAAESQLLQSSMLMMAQARAEQAPSGPPGLSATPTFSGLVRALRRRWPVALGAAAAAAILGVLAVFTLMPPKYLVTMRVRVAAKQAGAEDIEFPIFKANMESLVKSPLVISAALNDRTADGRDIKDLDIVRNKGVGVVDWLEKTLKTDYLLGPEVLRVTLAADQADEAAELLNVIARAFLSEVAEMDRSKKQQRLAELRGKKERIEEELRLLRGVLDKQGKALDVKDLAAAIAQQQQWFNKLAGAEASKRSNDDEINKAESEIIACQAKLKNLGKQPVPEDVLYELYNRDLTIQSFNKRIAQVEEDIAGYYQKYNEPYASQYAEPLKMEKIKIREKREEREALLQPDIERLWHNKVRGELKVQMEIADERLQGYARRREGLQKEMTELERKVKEAGVGLQNKPPQIAATEEKIELARMALNQTALKISEVELEVPGSRISLGPRATPPIDKDRTQQTKIAGAGGMGIFVMALFGVAFLEFRSRKIVSPDDVAHGLGLNVIGTVPAMPARTKKSAPDSAAEGNWQVRLQESVDAIRTVILHQARGQALQVIMITSARGGEGKTTLASQLAASLARAWKRVLIIDGDLRHPAAHVLFDTPREPGLAEVLRGEAEATDAVRGTPFSRLWLLPAGNGDHHAIQALAQDNVGALFTQFKQQYDFIIIDAPPILPVTDSLLLGQHADGVLYAILSDVSLAPAVYAAQQKLAPLGLTTLGAVVLGTRSEFHEKNYAFALSGTN